MIGLKFISKLSAILLVLFFSSITTAEPYTVTYTDTIEADDGPFIGGEAFTISIVLDNGGSTTASQTWTSTDIVSITFNVNDDPGTITTVLSPVVLTTDNGSFVTDAGGVLTTAPIEWNDTASSSTILSSNDPGLLVFDFYINANNDVYFNETTNFSAGMTNVDDNTTAAFWTDPVASSGPGPGPGPGPATGIPTLSQWAMVLLSLMLLGIGLGNIRRFS